MTHALLEISSRLKSLPKETIESDLIEKKTESPRVPVRSMGVFLHTQDAESEWYYSREYWEEYCGMPAANRFNSFNLVFSHQTLYLTPIYPFYFKVGKNHEVNYYIRTAAAIGVK